MSYRGLNSIETAERRGEYGVAEASLGVTPVYS